MYVKIVTSLRQWIKKIKIQWFRTKTCSSSVKLISEGENNCMLDKCNKSINYKNVGKCDHNRLFFCSPEQITKIPIWNRWFNKFNMLINKFISHMIQNLLSLHCNTIHKLQWVYHDLWARKSSRILSVANEWPHRQCGCLACWRLQGCRSNPGCRWAAQIYITQLKIMGVS